MKISESLSSYMHGRDNNFNLIRFIAASLVIVSHSFIIFTGNSYAEPFEPIFGMELGTMCVDVFFVTSGFLVTASFLKRKSLSNYIESRVLRIFPGLIVMVIATVFIVGPIATTTPEDYFNSSETWKYLIRTSTLVSGVEFDLPGVFTLNPAANQVNSSLWTLPYELLMYGLIPAGLVIANVFSKSIKVDQGKILISAWFALMTLAISTYIYNLPFEKLLKLTFMFYSGAIYYIFRNRIPLKTSFFALFTASLAASLITHESFFITYILAIPYLTFFIAFRIKGRIRNFNKVEDYSYGIYIYGFICQQLLMQYISVSNIYNFILLSLIVTLIPAIFSWHFIEKTALKYKQSRIFHSTPTPAEQSKPITSKTQS